MSEEFNHFLAAQKTVIAQVEDELSRGRKETHWMWFFFPQITGLGQSSLAQRFAIDSIAQARRYFKHPVLGQRLRQHVQLVIDAPVTDITEVFDYPDDLKFHSCVTLFALANPDEPVFNSALVKYFDECEDVKTLEILGPGFI